SEPPTSVQGNAGVGDAEDVLVAPPLRKATLWRPRVKGEAICR
ncbi:hypothetical protein A2U01_0053482, partial [Trifolium medium]|nr:hypothetical protein [Trifolium medium]